MFKYPQDAIWHASALEGMATIHVLDAWSAGHGLVRLSFKILIHGADRYSHSRPLVVMQEMLGLILVKS
jgi:hypothetical protein